MKNSSPIKIICLILLLVVLAAKGNPALGQDAARDTTRTHQKHLIHSPRRATVYSALLPGLGQIYNRKYWKLPLVYGGFATLGYFINFNNDVYITYRQAYSDIIDNNPFTNSYLKLAVNPIYFQPDKLPQLRDRLKIAQDGWRRNRDLVIIGTIAFYAANIIDASVDANFFNFSMSDDLTFNWAPEPMMCLDNKLVGVHCIITF